MVFRQVIASTTRPVSNVNMRFSRRNIWFLVAMCLLVLALRLWADYSQAQLRASSPTIIPLLLNHAPADAFRFVLNFPASLLARWTFPPPATKTFIGLHFVWHEIVSIAVELALTVACWLGVIGLLQSKAGSRLKKLPLRVVLPIVLLLVSAALDHYGTLQYDRVMHSGPHFEPLPMSLGRDWFVGYAINAPAYAVWQQLPWALYSNARVWDLYVRLAPSYSRSVEYFAVVLLMWFLIGARIDQRRSAYREPLPRALSWWRRAGWMACVLYGGFLCALPNQRYYDSESEFWFPLAILVWGTLLITIGFRVLANDTSHWGSVGRIFSAVFGTIASCVALLSLLLDNFGSRGYSGPVKAIWALCIFALSIYVLFKKRQQLTARS